MASVTLDQVRKNYGALEVVKGVNFEVADKEFVVLVGPSGCGKSTTLRMIAGLESITAGAIRIDDDNVTNLAPRERDVAMVFQDYALYPHKTVYDNMAFGLRVRGHRQSEIEERVREAASMLGIEWLLERKPSQLSGGQRQRVAMGRAIVRRPKVFLFDEPLSNLDAKLRGQVRTEIKKLHRAIEATIVYVTHDQVEAMTLADRIVVMNGGVVEQIGTPDEVYQNPASIFVANFMGAPAMSFVSGEVVRGQIRLANGDEIALAELSSRLREGDRVQVGMRPEHFAEVEGSAPTISGTVEVTEPLGPDTLVQFKIGDDLMTARVGADTRPAPGSHFAIGYDRSRLRFFDPQTTRSLTVSGPAPSRSDEVTHVR